MTTEISDENRESIEWLSQMGLKPSELKARIETLDISADAKVILLQLATKVVRIGETVVKIGQKVLELVFKFTSSYPNTTFGVVFGAIAGTLISSIPIIGFVLGPLVSPILLLLGIALGAKTDFVEKAMEARIKSSLEPFNALKA
ncbi:hypothetical protein [Cribrihabitans neustonicus]|uniref:hypothetical protein n=1 Tax=Cribrihabitans neustonicus TaxID=1429085 RepID=UPI003B5CE8B6